MNENGAHVWHPCPGNKLRSYHRNCVVCGRSPEDVQGVWHQKLAYTGGMIFLCPGCRQACADMRLKQERML